MRTKISTIWKFRGEGKGKEGGDLEVHAGSQGMAEFVRAMLLNNARTTKTIPARARLSQPPVSPNPPALSVLPNPRSFSSESGTAAAVPRPVFRFRKREALAPPRANPESHKRAAR